MANLELKIFLEKSNLFFEKGNGNVERKKNRVSFGKGEEKIEKKRIFLLDPSNKEKR